MCLSIIFWQVINDIKYLPLRLYKSKMKKTNINALNMERYIYYLKDINFEESTYLDYLET